MTAQLWSRLLIGACLVALAVFAWRALFPTEEARIRRQLDALVDDVNDLSGGVSGLAAAAKLATFFTEDVVVDPGRGATPLRGREVILAAAGHWRPVDDGAEISLADVDVTVAPDEGSAAVTLTALRGSDAHEFALTMVKRESAWLISHVTAISPLR